MQIISGKFRARKLIGVEGDTTRPTLARVKESIFNLIQWNIDGSVVLDLFAGSGAFGAECISRNAKMVYFCDIEKKAIKSINYNTRQMGDNFEILNMDFKKALSLFSSRTLKFDIIYLDPPYKSVFARESLELIDKFDLLAEDGIIVIEHESQNDLQNIPKCYIIEKSRKYGIAYVDILSRGKVRG